MATWTLEDPVLGMFMLDPTNDIEVIDYDLGFATVRSVSDENPNADGEDDMTSLSGARVVTLNVKLFGATSHRQQMASVLRGWLDPRRRIMLVWDSAGFGKVRFPCRGDGYGGPVQAAVAGVAAQLTFVVPRGIFESYDLAPASPLAIAAGSAAAGWVYPYQYPRVYPAAPVAGLGVYRNLGTARVYPVLRAWGPVTNPVVALGPSGFWSLSANGGVVLAAGEYVDIDTFGLSIVKNTGDLLFRYLNKSTVSWGWMEPLDNEVHYTGTGAGSETHIDVLWRHGWR